MPKPEPTIQIDELGAVVLCGGKSTRLGIDKTQLVFRDKTFLEQVVSQVSQVCRYVVLVGDIDYSAHNLPNDIIIEHDQVADKGPVEGIRTGLERLSRLVEYGFVTSCDVPLLKPDLIRHLFKLAEEQTGAVPIEGKRVYGMTAIYRTELHHLIENRIQEDQLRVSELAEAFGCLQPTVESLKVIDPTLDSMTNVNSRADYLRLLSRFDLECPQHLLDAIGGSGS